MTESNNEFPTEFVPVSRILIDEFGYQVAYVWGIVWSFCQMQKGLCDASHDKIADRAGMSRRSVINHINELIENGYIEDLTPGIRNEPHKLSVERGMQILHTKEQQKKEQKPLPEPERCEEIAHQNGVGMQDLPSGYAEIAQPGMQILHKKRYIEETPLIDIKDMSSEDDPPPPTEKPAKAKKAKEPDSPAFKVYVDITNYWKVTTHWRNKMAEIVGEKPNDLELWGQIVEAYTGYGWWEGSVKIMLEYFQRREIPTKQRNNGTQSAYPRGQPPPPSGPPTVDLGTAFDAVRRK